MLELDIIRRDILHNTGFGLCTFEPDETTCDYCGEPHLQLYYRRTTWDVEEGEYFCLSCINKTKGDLKRDLLAFRLMEAERRLKEALPIVEAACQVDGSDKALEFLHTYKVYLKEFA